VGAGASAVGRFPSLKCAVQRSRVQSRHHANYAGIASSLLFSKLRDHVKRRVTGQRAAGRGHSDVPVRRANGNRGFYQGVRLDGKCCGSSVERDARGSGELLPEQAEVLPNFGRPAHKSDEGAKTDVLAEDCAAARRISIVAGSVASVIRNAVKLSISGLNKRAEWVRSVVWVSDKVIECNRLSAAKRRIKYASVPGTFGVLQRPYRLPSLPWMMRFGLPSQLVNWVKSPSGVIR
jgi:hypothetical protein